jgi:hypothetical protein
MDHSQILRVLVLFLIPPTTSGYSVLSSRPSFTLFGKMKAYSEVEVMVLKEKCERTLTDLENKFLFAYESNCGREIPDVWQHQL